MEHRINCFEDLSQEDLDKKKKKIKENAVWQKGWMGAPKGPPVL